MLIYLDNASTTKPSNQVIAAIQPFLRCSYENPSSIHSGGRAVRKAIEHAREQVAKSINAEPNQIFFTSGASESNAWVLSNYNATLCSRVEHASIYNHPNTIKMDYNPLANQIYKYMPDLVSHMLVNNETGEIYDIQTMAKISHDMNKPFHTDATQSFGHVPIDVKSLNVDSLSISGHKIHALKNCGILYLKEPSKYKPLIYGGHQEKGMRAGTENVLGIIAIGQACECHNYKEETDKYILSLKTHLQDYIANNIPNVMTNSKENSVSNILNVSFKDIEGESLMLMLDREGIAVSSGSACNSGSLEPSYVLKDLGVPDDYIYGTVRFSFSYMNTLDEIIEVEQKLKTIVEKLRTM